MRNIGVVLCTTVCATTVSGLSSPVPAASLLTETRTVALPFVSPAGGNSYRTVQHAFDYIVEYSGGILETADPVLRNENDVATNSALHSSCRIPATSKDISIDFYLDTAASASRSNDLDASDQAQFVLQVSGTNLDETFGKICVQLYRERKFFQGLLGVDSLLDEVANHFNRQPPSPGYVANSQETESQQDFLGQVMKVSHLQQLQDAGYVVLETKQDSNNAKPNGKKSSSFETNAQSHDLLTQYLVKKTGDVYRSDKVHFLSRPEAEEAGILSHFEMLMSIPAYLNQHVSFRTSDHTPIAPATRNDPLTIPRIVQLAEYSEGDFYGAHSDNSYEDPNDDDDDDDNDDNERDGVNEDNRTTERTRQNFRHYTCILYCNDMSEGDGGALRLYLQSRDSETPEEAMDTCSFVDIIPKNGRLLIFDSCLVHSVERVVSPDKPRRALTLWVLRPNDSGVKGEVYY